MSMSKALKGIFNPQLKSDIPHEGSNRRETPNGPKHSYMPHFARRANPPTTPKTVYADATVKQKHRLNNKATVNSSQ